MKDNVYTNEIKDRRAFLQHTIIGKCSEELFTLQMLKSLNEKISETCILLWGYKNNPGLEQFWGWFNSVKFEKSLQLVRKFLFAPIVLHIDV